MRRTYLPHIVVLVEGVGGRNGLDDLYKVLYGFCLLVDDGLMNGATREPQSQHQLHHTAKTSTMDDPGSRAVGRINILSVTSFDRLIYMQAS